MHELELERACWYVCKISFSEKGQPVRRAALLIALLFGMAATSLTTALSAPLEGQTFGEFKLSCKANKMTDKKDCTLGSTSIVDKSPPFLGFSLLIYTEGQFWIVAENSIVAEVRVDKNKAFPFRCDGMTCIISGAPGKSLVGQLAKGKTLLLEVTTAKGTKEKEMDLEDYQKALAAYKAEMAAKP